MSTAKVSLEDMRGERNTFEAIFMQFVSQRKYHKTYAFCFYEGEDRKYYNSRLRDRFNDKIITYAVGNKKEVLKLLKKIRSGKLYDKSNVCMMFFVDRDYDESKLGEDVDLFETPCYSIENLYVQKECLKKILQEEFGMNPIDNDFKKCLQIFEDREREFNEHILEFNALLYLRRRQSDSNSNCFFGSVKTSHIVNIELNAISKASKYEETIMGIKSSLNFKMEDIEKSKAILVEKGECSLNFRGKNQLDFVSSFIKCLKKIKREDGYLENIYNSHLDITANRLSELNQYAITPSCLVNFLDDHNADFLNLVHN